MPTNMPAKPSKTPSDRAIAAALGITPAALSRYRRDGCTARDVEGVSAWQAANVDPAQRAGKESRTAPNFADERARLTAAQARREELKLRHEAGELVPVQAAALMFSAKSRQARDKLLGIRHKLQSRFNLPREVLEAVEQLHREALEELSGDGMPPELVKALEAIDA